MSKFVCVDSDSFLTCASGLASDLFPTLKFPFSSFSRLPTCKLAEGLSTFILGPDSGKKNLLETSLVQIQHFRNRFNSFNEFWSKEHSKEHSRENIFSPELGPRAFCKEEKEVLAPFWQLRNIVTQKRIVRCRSKCPGMGNISSPCCEDLTWPRSPAPLRACAIL